MRKRLLFISVVILVASSAASAGTWDWLWGFVLGGVSPYGQWQVGYATAGTGIVQQGAGTTSRTQGDTYGRTQISPWGIQSSTVTVRQTGSVTGASANSLVGVSGQIQVTTYQNQR